MVYYGCSTWPNRGRWLLIVAFSALGAALTVLHAFETAQCVRCETTVDGVEVCEDYKQGRDADWTGLKKCRTWWMIATAASFVACFALCTGSCISMCWAVPPSDEHTSIPLSTSQADSSHERGRQKVPCVAPAARASTSCTTPRSPPDPKPGPPPPFATTQKSTAAPPVAPTDPCARAAATAVQPSPSRSDRAPSAAGTPPVRAPGDVAENSRRRSPSKSSPDQTSRSVAQTPGLYEQSVGSAAAGASPARAGSAAGPCAGTSYAAAAERPPAAPVAEATAVRPPLKSPQRTLSGRSADAWRAADADIPAGVLEAIGPQSTVRPSPYVVLDSEGSFSPHSTRSMTSGGRAAGMHFASMQDMLSLEPAAAAGEPSRNAGDVLRSLEQLSYAGQTDTCGSQMLGPVPDRWFVLKPSSSRHSMRSALSAYAAAQEAEEAGGHRARPVSDGGSVSTTGSGAGGATSAAQVTVEPGVHGVGIVPEISLQLSGYAATGATAGAAP